MTRLGPNLSLKVPAMMLRKPVSSQHNEAAPEVIALDQPNSPINGLKKTPKD